MPQQRHDEGTDGAVAHGSVEWLNWGRTYKAITAPIVTLKRFTVPFAYFLV